MSDMPKDIWAYHIDKGTGTWIYFDDSVEGDTATQYTNTNTIREAVEDLKLTQDMLKHPPADSFLWNEALDTVLDIIGERDE